MVAEVVEGVGTLIQLRDRTLLLTDGVQDPGTWDWVVDLNPYKKNSFIQDKYLNFTLLSAHNGLQQKFFGRDWLENDIQIIGDSGGAQLKTGSAEYVDPSKVIDWYNSVVDIGMALDVPPRPVDQGDSEVLRALAAAQYKNNKVMLARKNERVKLMQCMHGYTLEQQREWGQRQQQEGFHGWSIGADNYASDLASLQSVLVARELGDKWSPRALHYHLFGVSGSSRVPAVAWLGRYLPTFTTDSTGYLSAVRTRTMNLLGLDGMLDAVAVGETSTLLPGTPIPCSCEVCRAVGYWEVYKLPSNHGTSSLLAMHNVFTLAQYTQFWNDQAQEKTYEEYYALVKQLWRKSRGETDTLIEYVEFAIQHGLDEANIKFKGMLGADPQRHRMPKLFGDSGDGVSAKNAMLNLTQ
ncbi:MAG: hypothetical protein WC895_04220, partial [Candidatus Shapirobacteria bacterium]